VNKGYDPGSLKQQTMTRYTLQQPLGQYCKCEEHNIVAHQDIFLHSCKWNVHGYD
jgi:hypothetical protein